MERTNGQRDSEAMQLMPFADEFPVFAQLREKAREFNLTKEEQVQYEYKLRNFIAYDGGLFLAKENWFKKGEVQGRAEGEAQKALETARKLKKLGIDINIISEATGFSPEGITLS